MRYAAPLVLVLAFAVLSGCRATRPYPVLGQVGRTDPAFNSLVPAGAQLEKLADGFGWSEGPVWRRSGNYLLFTDVPGNTIYRWDEDRGLTVFLRPTGDVTAKPQGGVEGSNGLVFDSEDRLVMADHGNRQVARLNEAGYTKTPLAERYQGKRLNSPNDVVYRSNGDLYFTDPPYGLKGLHQDPAKELEFSGVYRLTPSGELTLLAKDLRFPNGIAFSPDEKTLYVSNSDPDYAVWMAYEVRADGTVAEGRVLFDATALVREGKKGLPDGMAIDQQGNIFGTGPGGVLVLTPEGRHLGTIETDQATANAAFGGDGSTLYMTSHMNLLRIRLNTRGVGF